MAIDKAVDSGALDTGLTSIANKIRSRSGGSNQLLFPTGFVSEIDNIPQGGGGMEEKDVNFYDYDGSLVASYTATEFAALSAMPSNPSHTGLTAQGWNWTLADAKTYVASYGKLDVGQSYITNDGKTRLYVTLGKAALSPVLKLAIAGSVIIEWGDGTTETKTGANHSLYNIPHTYTSDGDYVITIEVATGDACLGSYYTSSSVYGCLMDANTPSVWNHMKYTSGITKIEIGANMIIGHGFAYRAFNLETISIPTTGAAVGPENGFCDCYTLKCVVFPRGTSAIMANCFDNSGVKKVILSNTITNLYNSAFRSSSNLEKIVIPTGITSTGQQIFSGCQNLHEAVIPNDLAQASGQMYQQCKLIKKITTPLNWATIPVNYCYSCQCLKDVNIPQNVTSIPTYAFYGCYSLTKLTIPSMVTSIGSEALSLLHSLGELHLKPTTPPTLTNAPGFPSDCIIYVPTGSLTDYQTATNWSTYASQMQEE